MGESLGDLKVPVELLRFIDEGGKPDIFTAELLKMCQEENQVPMFAPCPDDVSGPGHDN